MSVLVPIWLGLTGLALVVWISRRFQLSAAGRKMPPLHSGMYAISGPDPLPPVSWLVAAKDEGANIEACVSSLVRQQYPVLQVIDIDDRSTDATGAVLDRLAAGDPRLTAVHVQDLCPGWFGKNNAMREGVSRATGEWLCFTDADCVQVCPRSLTIAMRHALHHRADFLSVLPAHEMRGFWENVIQPACSGIMMIWFNPLRVNDPSRETAYANGAFMLMRRSCYEAIGGHEAVRTELNEDMHMARRAKAACQRLLIVSNTDLYTVRMYASLRQMCAGWSRIFSGCFGTLGRLTLSALAVVFFGLLPWVALVVGVVRAFGGESSAPWNWLAVSAGAACLAQAMVMIRFYPMGGSPAAYGLTYPLGAVMGLYALVQAILRALGRGSITWRGTTYRGTRVEGAVAPASAD